MQVIVHVVESLDRGGTETLLIDLLPELNKHYRIVLVTLKPGNTFGDSIIKTCYGYYCLNYKGYQSFISSIIKLKKIIRKHDPVLVRSQLILGTLIARLACPRDKPFVFSIHSIVSQQIQKNIKGWVIRTLEKLTPRETDTLIGVSNMAVNDYKKNFQFKGRSFVLYNYVREEFFSEPETTELKNEGLRLVAIGNLRTPKNYFYLVEAFKLLRNENVSLDIYGNGPLFNELNALIKKYNVNIHLKGATDNTFQTLKNYDAFVMVSSFEGFGIAVAEAMAVGKPLILSDIEVLREITHSNAFFVDISKYESFASIVQKVNKAGFSINFFSEINKKIAKENYAKFIYMQKLLDIYSLAVKGQVEGVAG